MLVLTRKSDEVIVVGGFEASERKIRITVVAIKNGHVRLGIEADADVPVNRFEVWERMASETRPPNHHTESDAEVARQGGTQ